MERLRLFLPVTLQEVHPHCLALCSAAQLYQEVMVQSTFPASGAATGTLHQWKIENSGAWHWLYVLISATENLILTHESLMDHLQTSLHELIHYVPQLSCQRDTLTPWSG